SRGTPRIANRLLRRVRDFAEVRADGVVTLEIARAALELYEVDTHGLDRLDRAVLRALITPFGGGPAPRATPRPPPRAPTPAAAVAGEAGRAGGAGGRFLGGGGLSGRRPGGRVAPPLAWEPRGLPPPDPAGAGGVTGPGTLFDEEPPA